jgi:hypothetical protein
MRKLMIQFCFGLITLLIPSLASAQTCGTATKIMRIERYAFVPDVQHTCFGDQVAIYNASGKYISFEYKDIIGRKSYITGLANGSYIWLYSSTDIKNVRGYDKSNSTGSYYDLKDGEIRSGLAPDSY